MDNKIAHERNAIINDLHSISKELSQLAAELKRYKGVGTEFCSNKMVKEASNYKAVASKLYQLK
jgi:hypothetical protein